MFDKMNIVQCQELANGVKTSGKANMFAILNNTKLIAYVSPHTDIVELINELQTANPAGQYWCRWVSE